jgi:hypothetical protein
VDKGSVLADLVTKCHEDFQCPITATAIEHCTTDVLKDNEMLTKEKAKTPATAALEFCTLCHAHRYLVHCMSTTLHSNKCSIGI